mmetsp:Transcript_22311/g.54508  ORF Transcript_22311/g.54508 Transcript_22311/m.54508 type:complete len:244 (+) Transcript_22311:20-751(+)
MYLRDLSAELKCPSRGRPAGHARSRRTGTRRRAAHVASAHVEHHGGGLLEVALDGVVERRHGDAVEHAVVGAPRDVHEVRAAHVAALVEARLDAYLGERRDGHLGQQQHGRGARAAHRANVGQRDGAAAQVGRRQLAGGAKRLQARELVRHLEHAAPLDVLDVGHEQAVRRVHGHAHVVRRLELHAVGGGAGGARVERALGVGAVGAHRDARAEQRGGVVDAQVPLLAATRRRALLGRVERPG